jgi:hypothetical protein
VIERYFVFLTWAVARINLCCTANQFVDRQTYGGSAGVRALAYNRGKEVAQPNRWASLSQDRLLHAERPKSDLSDLGLVDPANANGSPIRIEFQPGRNASRLRPTLVNARSSAAT